MSKYHESVDKMWIAYIDSIGESPDTTLKTYDVWCFGNDRQSADYLVQLVLDGTKRATVSSYELFAYKSEKMPEVDDINVVTDYDGLAKCVLITTHIDIVPFRDVTAEFAAIEGEGDKSLDYWREAHIDFFTNEYENFDKTFSEEALIVCEQFELVYK